MIGLSQAIQTVNIIVGGEVLMSRETECFEEEPKELVWYLMINT